MNAMSLDDAISTIDAALQQVRFSSVNASPVIVAALTPSQICLNPCLTIGVAAGE